jgi:Tol biopolymer transport system component
MSAVLVETARLSGSDEEAARARRCGQRRRRDQGWPGRILRVLREMTMNKLAVVLLSAACALSAPGAVRASADRTGVSSQRPSPSPSGTEVIFSADFDGPNHLWVCGLDGSNLHKLAPITNGIASRGEDEPAWSPDGQQIAFVFFGDQDALDIWVMRPDGAFPVRLTTAGKNSDPAWSPDSSKIAFVSNRDGTKDIWIMNRDGTGQKKLVTSSAQENHPSFSPDGSKVVFSQTGNGSASLAMVNVNGSSTRKITSGVANDWDPVWGPQGIVFTSNRGEKDQWKLWKVQADGTGLQKIGDVRGHEPVWLRDGRILFVDETLRSKALSAVSVLTPATGARRVVADVQGQLTPIDIRPRKTPNRINPKSNGKVEVAILSTPTFDATKAVVQSSLIFGATGSEATLQDCRKDYKDVNRDGRPDLICRFSPRNAGFQAASTVGVLRFDDAQGNSYEGRDSITIWPGEDPDDFRD